MWCRAGNRGRVYTSQVGNQCGCGAAGFHPSDSVWVPGNNAAASTPDAGAGPARPDPASIPPSLRLVERLARANKTMCFAGDSIDLQFWEALMNNLLRIRLLQGEGRASSERVNVTIESNLIPVNYTNETTGPLDYGRLRRCMKDIKETAVSLDYGGERRTASLRYFKTYGWSPWNTPSMAGCDVVVANLALHYLAHGQMTNDYYGRNALADDFRAFVTYLAGFAGLGAGRVAVWRSALPQHFDGAFDDGHYPLREETETSCIPLPANATAGGAIQKYNRAYDEWFGALCNASSAGTACGHGVACTMNATDTSCRTVYKFLVDNNVTAAAGEIRRGGGIAAGDILRWEIADLFDVPQWHAGGGDCSHFCYIPALYEAAFERLDLLLPRF